MSIRFAGSRCVDERRRRRLAQEADGLSVEQLARADSDEQKSAGSTQDLDDFPRQSGDAPADSLISPRLWKHLTLCVLFAILWGAMLYFGDQADRQASSMRHVIGLQAGKLPRFFSTVMLLAAGQLSFISLWYRSRSRKDFKGSYKVWLWAALGWLTLCACQATGMHWNLADALVKGHRVELWNLRMMVWIMPAAVIVAALYRLLLREMRDAVGSLWLLRFSLMAAFLSAVSVIAEPFMTDAVQARLIRIGTGTLWHLLLAASMLLHARYVIHISNEPPVSPLKPWRIRLPRIRLRLRRSPRRKLQKKSKSEKERSLAETRPMRESPPVEADATEESTSKTKQRGAKSQSSKPSRTSKKTAPSRRKAPQQATSSDDQEEDPSLSVRSRPVIARVDSAEEESVPAPKTEVSRRSSSASEHGLQIAQTDWDDDLDDLDPERLRGLSKKERRRLRKLHKERQRKARQR